MRPIPRLIFTTILAGLALILVLPFAYAAPRELPLSDPSTELFEQTTPATSFAGKQSLLNPPALIAHAAIDDPALLSKIDPPLLKHILQAAPGEHIPIVIEMREQANLEHITPDVKGPARVEAVVGALRATAYRSQIGARTYLAVQILLGRARNVRPFWIFNGLAAHVVSEDITALAMREDVAFIREDGYRQYTDWQIHEMRDSNADDLSGPEWGITKIRADEVWSALNITGTGVVVANMDTGVDWQHQALQPTYRGNIKGLINHSGNWFDATPAQTSYPIDPHGHGTHTMGTFAGVNGIGVAPGAKWIAVRVLDATGAGFDSWIHAGFEWVLAPDGDASLAPHVLNNSWGNNISSNKVFQNDLRALRSAGIFAVFSNGNSGPDVGSVGSPASLPEAFAVGAIDIEDDVPLFSSRGPSPWNETRPHVAAPGVNVRSSVPGGGYFESSGTSMAAPHVAGTVALMLSANPSLSINDTARILTGSAVALSTTIPNNDSGYGRIDAYAAVQASANLGIISGSVTRLDTAAPIVGAAIVASSSTGSGGSTSTDMEGHYAYGLASSIYTVTASAFGYVTDTQSLVLVITSTTTALDFVLSPLPVGSVQGSLTDAQTGQPVDGTILVYGTPITALATNAYNVTLPGGTFELRAIASAHRIVTASVTVTPGQSVMQDFALPPAPTILLVDSGPWYQGSQISYYREAFDKLSYVYDEYSVKAPLIDAPTASTLMPYDIVVWSAPFDSPGFIGSGDAISQYLSAGGSLFLSGQDVGYWDGGLAFSWSDYYQNRLKARALKDESGSRALSGEGPFAGIDISLEGADSANNQAYPDAIVSADRIFTIDAFRYDNGYAGGLAVGPCLPYRAVYLGFGFEAVNDAAIRRQVMSNSLAYFASPRKSVGVALDTSSNNPLIAPGGRSLTQAFTLRNTAELGGADSFALSVQSSDWNVSLSDTSIVLDPCESRSITATIQIPPGTPPNSIQSITITAQSSISPALQVSESFSAKTPASVLLVDDDRFYDVESFYQSALISNGIAFDLWNVPKSWSGFEPPVPSLERLSWYPLVYWFTGYDWFQPLTANNETTLTQYLNGGGRLFLSSQDHLVNTGLDEFNRTQLGVLAYGEDWQTTSARGVSGGPFDGIGPMALVYTFPNFSDVLAPYPTSTVALVGSHQQPIALAHQTDGPQGQTGKTLFFAFPFESIPEPERGAVMERIVAHLSWLGASTVSADKTIVAPDDDITFEIVARNDGPYPIPSAAFTATLPAGMSLESGSTSWSGSLASGQSVSVTFTAELDGSPSPGDVMTLPVKFADDYYAITFDKEVYVNIARPDLSASTISVDRNPLYPFETVTWTVVARNTGMADATSARVTAVLPIDTQLFSGSLMTNIGTASAVSRTAVWNGLIPAASEITFTYQMTIPSTLTDRLYYGSVLLDDGTRLSQSGFWLAVRPYLLYFAQIFK